MRNFQNNRKHKPILESWPVLFVLFMLIVFFSFGIFELMNKMKETTEKKNLAEKKMIELKERKNRLMLDIDNLNTDEGKEKIFRENFGLAKEGEELIIVIDDKNESENKKELEKKGVFSNFKNYFK